MTFLNPALENIFSRENFLKSEDFFFQSWNVFFFILKQYFTAFTIFLLHLDWGTRAKGGGGEITELAHHVSANFNRFQQ